MMRWVSIGLLTATLQASGQMIPLGVPNPGASLVPASGISGDGRVVFVTSLSPTPAPFRWTPETGYSPLALPPPYQRGGISAVNRDGSAVVGTSLVSFPNDLPVRTSVHVWDPWNATSREIARFGYATGISDDGRYITFSRSSLQSGLAQQAARIRTSDGAMEIISQGAGAMARGISRDGNTVVGRTAGQQAFKWTPQGGVQLLPSLTAPPWPTIADGISGDGSIIFGRSERDGVIRVVRWDGSPTPELLGIMLGAPVTNLDIGAGLMRADDTGRIVVGAVSNADGFTRSFAWTRETGFMFAADFLAAKGLDLKGWSSLILRDISDDGQRIVGDGVYYGVHQPFLAIIPAPASAALLAPLTLLAARRRRVELPAS